MWGLFVVFFTSVLSLYLVSFGLVMKGSYDKVLGKSVAIQESFVMAENARDLQMLVVESGDIKRDNCFQVLAQICYTLSIECNKTQDIFDVWGWAIASVSPSYSVLDGSDYYVDQNNVLRLRGSGFIDLANVPSVTTRPTGCVRSDLIQRGAYYYNIVGRLIGCDSFLVDINGVKVGGFENPCSYVDILRAKPGS